MGIGHTCGYLNIEGFQYSLVPFCVTAKEGPYQDRPPLCPFRL